jgi:hypothetical protein
VFSDSSSTPVVLGILQNVRALLSTELTGR